MLRRGDDWTPEQDAMLKHLWTLNMQDRDLRMQATDIARLLGKRTKSSVIGRAHRQGLPARPNPGGRRGPLPDHELKYGRKSHQPINRDLSGVVAPKPKPERNRSHNSTTGRFKSSKSKVPTERHYDIPLSVPEYQGRVEPCCWPIGEPGKKGFRMCDEPSNPGKPYCGDHFTKSVFKRTRPIESPATHKSGVALFNYQVNFQDFAD